MDKIYEQFRREGCLKIENFLTPEEVEELRKGVSDVEENIDDNSCVLCTWSKNEADDDFINSADKSKITTEKKQALNEFEDAIHWHPIFKKHTFSQKVKDLLKVLQYKDPVVVQSMLILRKPKMDEAVETHQDSALLRTEPPTCIALGFPLDDVTLENGCPWYIPGSHKGDPVYQRCVLTEGEGLKFEGKLPEFSDEEYVPVPAKKGDCFLLHGCVLHKNGLNTTQVTTTMYACFMVEKDAKWSPLNLYETYLNKTNKFEEER